MANNLCPAGRSTRQNKTRLLCAFTLVELLVVVAIIALLLAILLPALGKARASAQSAVCMSSQKSTALALNMYATDLGKAGCILANWNKPDARGGSDTWVEWLINGQYVPNMQAIRCTSWRIPRDWCYPTLDPVVNGYKGYSDDPWICYGLRTLNETAWPRVYDSPFVPMQPGACPWGADSVQILYNSGAFNQYFQIDGYATGVVHLRHLGKANLFYGDSHVESRDINQLEEYGTKGESDKPHYMFFYRACDESLNVLN